MRTARTEDLPAIGAVQAQVWRDAFGELVEPQTLAEFTPAAFEAAWRESLQTPPSPVHRLLVATELDEVVGFVALGPTDRPTGGEILSAIRARFGTASYRHYELRRTDRSAPPSTTRGSRAGWRSRRPSAAAGRARAASNITPATST